MAARLILLAPALALACAPAPALAQDDTVAVARSVEADGTTTLVHEVTLPANRAEVWRAISTAEGWMEWAVPMAWSDPSSGTLETSYNPSARPGDPDTIMQQFVLAVPERLLAFRTTRAPAGFPHADTYFRVTSLFELDEVPDGIRLRLTSVNFAATSEGEQLADFFAVGNATTLESLRQAFTDGPRD